MYRLLRYGGQTYNNFTIDTHGVITNTKTGNTLKPHKNCNGYMVVSLPIGQRGKVKVVRLHKALAETFIPNPDNLPVVNHIDEDKSNYALSNLEWVTGKENVNKHLHIASQKDWFINNRKLSDGDVMFIRNHSGKLSYKKLSNMFGVSTTTIRNVIRRISYADL